MESVINLQGRQIKVEHPDKPKEFVIKEISTENQMYSLKKFKFIDKIKTFIDVGSSVGFSSIWAHEVLKVDEIISFEASKEIEKYYNKNTSYFKEKIIHFNNAVDIKNDEVIDFYYSSEHSDSSTTNESMVTGKHNTFYKVETICLAQKIFELTKNRDKDSIMMKIDIEGAEKKLFRDPYFLEALSKKIGYLLITLHGDLEEQIDELNLLHSYFSDDRIAYEIQSSSENKKNGVQNYIKPLGIANKINSFYGKFLSQKKLIVILTTHNQRIDVIKDNSIQSINEYYEYIDELIVVSSNEIKNLGLKKKFKQIILPNSTKNQKLLEASKYIENTFSRNDFVLVLDSDDKLVNLKEFISKINSNDFANSDLLIADHLYYRDEKITVRHFDPIIKSWGWRDKFPYYGNHSMIVRSSIFVESYKDLDRVDWQRGEDGFRMLQYFSKAQCIRTVNEPFIQYNRLDGVEHASKELIVKNSELGRQINTKFESLYELVKTKKINFWHPSQWNWLEISIEKYNDVLEEKTNKKILNLLETQRNGNLFRFYLTIYDPEIEDLRRWASYNLNEKLIILNDNPDLSLAKREFINTNFRKTTFIDSYKNKKRLDLVLEFSTSCWYIFDHIFKIIDPDDSLISNQIEEYIKKIEKFNHNNWLILEEGNKVFEEDAQISSFSSEYILHNIAKKNFRFKDTFATFQMIHSTKGLKYILENFTLPKEIQFHDDRLMAILYINKESLIAKFGRSIYLQYHHKGQTSGGHSEKEKEDLIKIFNFSLENNLKIHMPDNSFWQEILKESGIKHSNKNIIFKSEYIVSKDEFILKKFEPVAEFCEGKEKVFLYLDGFPINEKRTMNEFDEKYPSYVFSNYLSRNNNYVYLNKWKAFSIKKNKIKSIDLKRMVNELGKTLDYLNREHGKKITIISSSHSAYIVANLKKESFERIESIVFLAPTFNTTNSAIKFRATSKGSTLNKMWKNQKFNKRIYKKIFNQYSNEIIFEDIKINNISLIWGENEREKVKLYNEKIVRDNNFKNFVIPDVSFFAIKDIVVDEKKIKDVIDFISVNDKNN